MSDSTRTPTKTTGPNYLHIAIWGAVISLLILTGWGLHRANAVRPEAGQPAPTFNMEFFNGYEWESLPASNLEDMHGNVIVLNFWASWCVECRYEADLLEESWQRYRDQGVIFLGVAWLDAEHRANAYLEEFNITYPNAPDLGSRIARDYEITGVPETFFIGKDGTIAHVVIGPVNQQMVDAIVTDLLAQ
jgi:cytochrome c biogenesis protein CcmG, thiol:disulfide interchange protein DsbE